MGLAAYAGVGLAADLDEIAAVVAAAAALANQADLDAPAIAPPQRSPRSKRRPCDSWR